MHPGFRDTERVRVQRNRLLSDLGARACRVPRPRLPGPRRTSDFRRASPRPRGEATSHVHVVVFRAASLLARNVCSDDSSRFVRFIAMLHLPPSICARSGPALPGVPGGQVLTPRQQAGGFSPPRPWGQPPVGGNGQTRLKAKAKAGGPARGRGPPRCPSARLPAKTSAPRAVSPAGLRPARKAARAPISWVPVCQ